MKTRSECLQQAALCEQMAASADRGGRRMLLETAAHWRTLAAHALETPCGRATLNGASRPGKATTAKEPHVNHHTRESKLKGGRD
jgi:hypothetical protein